MSSITSADESGLPAAPVAQGTAVLGDLRRQLWNGARVGAAAALVASGLMLWAGKAWGGVILPQLISDRMTSLIPVSLFGQALGSLESNAKPLTLLGITLAQALVGALAGIAYARVAASRHIPRIAGAAALGGLIWLVLSLGAAPAGQVGLFAVDAPGELWRTHATFLLASVVFGLLTAAFVPWPAAGAVAADPSRRQFVRRLAVWTLVMPAVLSGWYVTREARRLRQKSAPPPRRAQAAIGDGPFEFAGMPAEITATDEFYVVSKNIVDPKVDSTKWSLEISGLVERPFSLSYSDLLTRPSIEFVSTLECISNFVGGDYISTAVWRGIPLKALLEEAGLQPGVVDIELHAADGYVESFPLVEGLADDTMLVHTMNGAPLTDEHGYPARLIVPGIFGMKNVKWLEKIVAVDSDIQGFWQERGWSDVATVVTMSRVDTPRAGDELYRNEPFLAGGVAFSGDRGIARVEVSFDGGATWTAAQLSEPLSNLTWRLWRIEHTPLETGKLHVTARAVDGLGNVQVKEEREPLPDGATGYHTVSAKVVERPASDPTPTTTGAAPPVVIPVQHAVDADIAPAGLPSMLIDLSGEGRGQLRSGVSFVP
jgi:DMSO/TMAO reductase YedYZ molybdopterin-dependent catalytic subunit